MTVKPHTGKITSFAVRILKDQSYVVHRLPVVRALGVLARNTGHLVDLYAEQPQIMSVLFDLCNDDNMTLREEVFPL